MTTALVVMVGVLLLFTLAVIWKGDIKATFTAPFLGFSLEAKDKRKPPSRPRARKPPDPPAVVEAAQDQLRG
jgi:hypothetical protein